jgi:hypothetical protein
MAFSTAKPPLLAAARLDAAMCAWCQISAVQRRALITRDQLSDADAAVMWTLENDCGLDRPSVLQPIPVEQDYLLSSSETTTNLQ